MCRDQAKFLFLNIGHFLDHLFMLVFASVAALRLIDEWNMSYSELIPYATPGFIAFGACTIPAGWLADKWSRDGMMVIFFIGIGTSSLVSGMANTPVQIAIGLTLVGIFAAIYHPVGLAMVVHGREKTGIPLAINGVFGNMGVASAALLTGILIDTSGWRSAFFAPGIVSIMLGIFYLWFLRNGKHTEPQKANTTVRKTNTGQASRGTLIRVFGIIFFTTAMGGLIFQSTTFSLPKVFDEQLAVSATLVGWYSFVVFSVAAVAQLVVGHFVDNHSIRTVFAVVAAMQASLFAVMTQVSGVMALVVALAFMLFVFGQIPINDVLVGRMIKTEWRSRAYAVRYVVTFTVMASVVPLIAWIHGIWGFDILFSILSIAAILIFLATLLLPNNQSVQGLPMRS